MARPEALRLLRIARRDLRMARRLLDPEVEEASWGWAAQQCLEKTLKAWLHHLGSKPPSTHDISRLLLPVPSPPSLCSTATTTNPKISAWIAQPGATGPKR
jgi:HEPN domain-containing protein